MPQLTPFELVSGRQIFVEVEDEQTVVRVGGRREAVTGDAASTLVGALSDVREAADEAISELSRMSAAPARIELAFGVKLTAEAKAVIAKAGAEAQFTVTVVWERGPGDPA
ncbi:hypothetical protein J2S43_001337 [Catenuloplanes nepalensis]|uniref:Trypsin-co-occurring domain-containing protein n=1 Tax=Catenuloplanes nepalensis TaxID=587533 RepID=A0ABT9MN30_9ACTN|nr:CU044_2847 family protein [Catenuloplanes nepalensis]MDP9792825.1 hypothetical protein [Catenuloplanes nepalensis]